MPRHALVVSLPAGKAGRLALCILFLLVTSYLLPATTLPVYAQSAPPCKADAKPGEPPAPCPCKNAIPEDPKNPLVDNVISLKDGETTYNFTVTVPIKKGETKHLDPISFEFDVDFSNLQALFGQTGSNYLEGNYQDDSHRNTNLLGANSVDLNQYNGPVQKTSPSVLTDQLKVKYVDYVYKNPSLAESANTYTDIEGKGDPKTIFDLVKAYGKPKPPDSKSSDADRQQWLQTWGKYWPKIPTAYSEFYQAELWFKQTVGEREFHIIQTTETCPWQDKFLTFVMPEFFRTTATSDQLNRMIVPCQAQSYQQHGLIQDNSQPCPSPASTTSSTKTNNSITDAIGYCWKLLTQSSNSIFKKIINTAKISFNFINPLKPVFAQTPPTHCTIPILDPKHGLDPYCPLPQTEAQRLKSIGALISCGDKTDTNKLEKDNPNVVCKFKVTIQPKDFFLDPNPDNPDFKSCKNTGGDNFSCDVKIRVWPNFRIPWLAGIWNNTTYADSSERAGIDKTGQPGIYGFFTPKSIIGGAPLPVINQPSQTQQTQDPQDPKERLLGATDCNEFFVRDLALKPKALQDFLGIQPKCADATGGTTGGGPLIVGDSCHGKYNSTNCPKGNFGDPNCDFTDDALYNFLKTLAPTGPINQVGTVEWWFDKITPCESPMGGLLRDPNAWLTGDPHASFHSPDPNGAWGLYQMGSTGLANPRYDFGNVEWKQQTRNAINLLKENGPGYWKCARR